MVGTQEKETGEGAGDEKERERAIGSSGRTWLVNMAGEHGW